MYRQIGNDVRILQLNVEGLSKAKSDQLSRILIENNIDVAVIQETHVATVEGIRSRGTLPGYCLIGVTYHQTYGTATYIRSNITNANLVTESSTDNIFIITINIAGLFIVNVYKPPDSEWPLNVLPIYNEPTVYIGDFNSHHSLWKYASNDINGESLVDWSDCNQLHLVFDAKDRGTFFSRRWLRDYNPDLCFVSSDHTNRPIPAFRTVLKDFPHSQHRPVIISMGIQIPLIKSVARPRWNFNKANWNLFSKELDSCIRFIPPHISNYDRFYGMVQAIAKKHIPRGYRKEYIPGWSVESTRLYQEFEDSGNTEIADELLKSLDENRKLKWENTLRGMDFTHSSRKAWNVLKKISCGSTPQFGKTLISPNVIANRILKISQAPSDKIHTREIKRELRRLKLDSQPSSVYSQNVTIEEITIALTSVKTGKAAGFDNIYPEFLKHMGKNTKRWLSVLFSKILNSGNLPKAFKETKIIAILKPGKEPDRPESYRPIALLSTCYKLLERVLFNRISPTINEHIPVDQAGFRSGRSCTDQVLALTTYIESGFENMLKTSVSFIDLTAAYDTIWRQGLIYKLLRIIPCRKTAQIINNMLSNRIFQVFMGDKKSEKKKLNNGLPQGSVLAPLLFNLYIHDLPTTVSRKFAYADDIALATQSKHVLETEETLNVDLENMNVYFRKWRLCPSLSKTEVSCFHLNSKMASYNLNVIFGGVLLNHNYNPKYLGVTLDRSLTFRTHISNVAGKLRTRNNIIQKLTGTSWGATASTLRIAAIGLVYSAAEYCSPIWMNSAHVSKIDTQLNNTMRLITGTLRSTPIHWLPVLSNIAPPNLRRLHAALREYTKITCNEALPINNDIPLFDQHQRLCSRRPSIKTAMELSRSGFNINDAWKIQWINSNTTGLIHVENPFIRLPGFDLPRHIWARLNRIRSKCGVCADFLHICGVLDTPLCDCGADRQTIVHIVTECQGRSYPGDLNDFLESTTSATDWIKNLDLNL